MLQSLDNGRYTVLRPLGRGGMGALYLATDHGAFDRTVVVKVLLEGQPGAPEAELQAARARFAHEARTLAALRHPFIPAIFGYFVEGNACFIVMEHVAGRDLEQGLSRIDDNDQIIAGAPYPLADVVRWGAALCGVLQYLHAQRPEPVLHQDIKPSNLVRDEGSGALFLVDFGTAHAHGGAHSGGYGTPGYAPPEQYREQSEPRSDVYALAATLYHLATDDDPSAHPFSFPQLDALGELGEALRPALDKNPAARPDAAALGQALELLVAPLVAGSLLAPDRTALYDERQLAFWCENHWAAAARWMRSYAPADHLQRRWGKPALARRVRDALAMAPANDGAALDAALALLDPPGYGAAKPALIVVPDDIVRSVRRGWIAPVTVTVTNTGRRYVQARLMALPWLNVQLPVEAKAPGSTARFPSLGLAPGQSAALVVSGMPHGSPGGNAGDALELQEEGAGGLVTGNVLASVSLRYKRRWVSLRNLGAYTWLLLPLLTCAILVRLATISSPPEPPMPGLIRTVGFETDPTLTPRGASGAYPALSAADPTRAGPYPAPADPYPAPAEAMYDLARQAIAEQRWGEVRNYVDGLQQQHPHYRDSDAMLDEALYQLAHTAYGAKQWAEMLGPLLRLQARHPSYKDAEVLLKEAYYHPALIAFNSGDFAAAARDFGIVYDLDPTYLDTKSMLGYAYNNAAKNALAAGNTVQAQIYTDSLRQLNSSSPTSPPLPTTPAIASPTATIAH